MSPRPEPGPVDPSELFAFSAGLKTVQRTAGDHHEHRKSVGRCRGDRHRDAGVHPFRSSVGQVDPGTGRRDFLRIRRRRRWRRWTREPWPSKAVGGRRERHSRRRKCRHAEKHVCPRRAHDGSSSRPGDPSTGERDGRHAGHR